MAEQRIQLLIYVIILAIIVYGLWWVCVKFGSPQPVLWTGGAILLVIILILAANQLGAGAPSNFSLFPHH